MSFSDLDHAAQLDLLERLTRATLTEHYGLDGPELVMEVQQYEDNAVWRATAPDGHSYVVRLSIRDGRPANQQRAEMQWLESLTCTGAVAVPGPLATSGGGYVVPLEVPGHDEPSTLALLRWLPGTAEPPFRQSGMADAMGETTARLHQNAASVPIPEFDRPVWDAQSILFEGHALTHPDARTQLGDKGLSTLREVADRIAPALAQGAREDHGRIHGDLHRENMIELPDGGVGLIDFDDCGTGHYLLDIATVLSSIHRLCRTDPDTYDSFARAYLAGYTQVRPLPDQFGDLLAPYLLLRDTFVLNFVTTAAPTNEAVATWGPGRIAGILADIRAYLDGRPYPGTLTSTRPIP